MDVLIECMCNLNGMLMWTFNKLSNMVSVSDQDTLDHRLGAVLMN